MALPPVAGTRRSEAQERTRPRARPPHQPPFSQTSHWHAHGLPWRERRAALAAAVLHTRPLRLHECADRRYPRDPLSGFFTAPVPEVHRDLRGRQSAPTSSSPCATLETSAPPLASRLCPYFILTGSAVPSDHQPARTMKTSIGSGAPLNCGFSMTGELERSAPQTAPSMSGVYIIK
jgi:hypothetical protein